MTEASHNSASFISRVESPCKCGSFMLNRTAIIEVIALKRRTAVCDLKTFRDCDHPSFSGSGPLTTNRQPRDGIVARGARLA